MKSLERWRGLARRVAAELHAVYLACRDPRTPWYARWLALAVVAYAASPIDLIPDFIPVLGHLDDLLLVPLGIWLVLRLIPAEVLAESRERARAAAAERRSGWPAAAAIVLLWLALAGLCAWMLWSARHRAVPGESQAH